MEHHLNLVHNIPFFSIFFAMFCGIITPLIKNGRIARYIHGGMVAIVGVLSFILLVNVVQNGEAFTFMMGHFPAPWGNELRIGPLEALLAVLISVVMFLTITAGSEQIFKEIVPEKQSFYFIMLNATFGAMLAMTYTNDMFTAYVFIEILTIASCSLILAKGTKRSVVGTTHYLVFGCVGSGLFLLGVCILYGITGHLLFPQIKETIAMLMANGENQFALMFIVTLMFVGLGIKSALFPFHSALPTAYGSTMTTSNGILSGLVLKAYVILAIKLSLEVFTLDTLVKLQIADIMFVLGVLGMVMGSVFAVHEGRMKRMLAYSSVAQIGYIFMGIGLGSVMGIVAAVFHVFAHAVTKSMLFICCGSFIEDAGGKEQLENLKGAAHKNPLAGVAFTVGALSMIGVPLFAGFISKLYFAIAAIEMTGLRMVLVLAALAVSMILNAMYFLPSVIAIWSLPKEGKAKRVQVSPLFAVAMVLFIVVNFALGIGYRPIVHIVEM
ncbi:MAG: proton-conducting transporter membrane subunit, partial [Bacillota bacterium]|nr:proton-conducting transporter membrane subunit [Bacillota bacterium]